MSLARQYLFCFALAAMLLPRASFAEEAPIAGKCPALDAVLTSLDQSLEAKLEPEVRRIIRVYDLGETWQIQVGERKATYADPLRKCAERVRVATIFAALVLEPLETEPSVAPDLAPILPPPPPPPPPRPPSPPRRHAVELAPVLAIATAADANGIATTWGGSIRWAFTGMRYGVAVGVGGLAPTLLSFASYQTSVARAVADISLRVIFAREKRLSFCADVGPYLGVLWFQGHGQRLSQNNYQRHLDLGGRAALSVKLKTPWISPFISTFAEWSVREYSFVVDSTASFLPSRNLGTAPRLWLGGMAGAAIGF